MYYLKYFISTPTILLICFLSNILFASDLRIIKVHLLYDEEFTSEPNWENNIHNRFIEINKFYNDKFATNHLSLYSKDSFWRFQLQVCLPGIGERKATCDEDASAQIDTLAFVQCYLKNKSYEI